MRSFNSGNIFEVSRAFKTALAIAAGIPEEVVQKLPPAFSGNTSLSSQMVMTLGEGL